MSKSVPAPLVNRECDIITTSNIDINKLTSTKEISLASDPLDRVIGQDKAIALARTAANQHRHLLLVGPPGTGKSMIALALALHLPRPSEEVQIVQNPENPERPFVEVKTATEIEQIQKMKKSAAGECSIQGMCQ